MERIIFFIALLPILLLAGCVQANISNTSEEDVDMLVQPASEKIPATLWRAGAVLRPVNDEMGTAGGFMEVDIRDDLTFVPSVRLNLPPLEEGNYEVWLERAEPPGSIHIGPLLQDPENDSYYLGETNIKITENIKDFMTVLIATGDETVLKGTLRIVSGMRLDGEDEFDKLLESPDK